MENSAKACNVMCSKLGFSKGHDISLQDLSHSSLAQQPSKPGKTGTVRMTQRTHGVVSTYKLHCTAKTAKFFLARKLTATQVQKNMQNMLKATPTMWQLLQTMQMKNSVLPTKSQSMHLHYTQGHKTEGPTKTKFSPNDWVAPQLGLPEQSSTGRVKLNRCLYIKATREKLTWGDSVRHYASRSNSPRVLVQERLRDCRAGGHTQTCQPILPQTQIPRCLLGLRPPLTEWVPKPIHRQRAPKLRREITWGRSQAVQYPSGDAEAGFLALTHLLPNAHAGTSAGHR